MSRRTRRAHLFFGLLSASVVLFLIFIISLFNSLTRGPVLLGDLFTHGWRHSGQDILCTANASSPLLLLIMVISHPKNGARRDAIRKSWAQVARRQNALVVFLVGRSHSHEEENLREALRFGDLVINNVTDSYSNLTLKTMSALLWASTFCSRFKFLVKVDDDVFVQIPRLVQMAAHYDRLAPVKRVIMGNVASGWKPVRNRNSKYFISREQHPENNYPNFVTGPSYLVSADAARALLDAAWTQPYIPLEDVFFTGVLADRLGIARRLVAEFKNNGERIGVQFMGCTLLRSISVHKVLAEEQAELMKASLSPNCGPL